MKKILVTIRVDDYNCVGDYRFLFYFHYRFGRIKMVFGIGGHDSRVSKSITLEIRD